MPTLFTRLDLTNTVAGVHYFDDQRLLKGVQFFFPQEIISEMRTGPLPEQWLVTLKRKAT